VPIAILVAGAAVGAWMLTWSTASAGPSSSLVPVVKTTMSQTLSTTGAIEPASTNTLSFSAAGQVTEVYATVGQHVTAGQALAVMSSPALVAQVAQAQATLAGDQARLSQDETGSASSAQLAADQASVSADQSQVDSAEQAASGATLTAPIDGIVATVGLTVGQQISGSGGGGAGGGDTGGGSGGGGGSGSDSGSGTGSGSGSGSGSGGSDDSITVVSANDVIDASVNASVVDHIKAGDPAVITTEGAAGPVTGTVASIGLTADTSSGVATFPVTIDVTGTPAGLYAGASANVTITYYQLANVLAVPSATISPGPGGQSTVRVMVHGRQVTKDVSTGLTSGGLTQITSGLTAGEQVVLSIVKLSPGSPGGPGGEPGGGVFFVGPGGGVHQRVVIIGGGPKGG
jgi:membrane fusion protein, macrolide-specific efflux system